MSDISIVSAACGAPEMLELFEEQTLANCARPHQFCLVVQAATKDEHQRATAVAGRLNSKGWNVQFEFVPEPLGSTRSFNRAAAMATGSILALLHNDLMIDEPGWDATLLRWWAVEEGLGQSVGVVGLHGARGLGAPDIYRTPYQLHQLARWDTFSNLEDAEIHGARVTVPRPAAVLDGMALILRAQTFQRLGGLDEGLGQHHMYDVDLCLRALEGGAMNFMVPLRARHLGGHTATASRYNDWLRRGGLAGADSDVHRQAHERFYAKWAGKLPISVPHLVAR